MLNDIWNGLINDVEGTKRCFNELEAASMMANGRLNGGSLVVIKSMDTLETKKHSLHAMYNDM